MVVALIPLDVLRVVRPQWCCVCTQAEGSVGLGGIEVTRPADHAEGDVQQPARVRDPAPTALTGPIAVWGGPAGQLAATSAGGSWC